MIRSIFILACLTVYPYVWACSFVPPPCISHDDCGTLEERNVASSDIVFQGFLTEAKTTTTDSANRKGYRVYKFSVIESFKSPFEVGEIVELWQGRGVCSFPLGFDQEYFVFAGYSENGKLFVKHNTRGAWRSHLSSKDKLDKELIDSMIEYGTIDEYEIITWNKDGSPDDVIMTKEKKIQKLRNAAHNKKQNEMDGSIEPPVR